MKFILIGIHEECVLWRLIGKKCLSCSLLSSLLSFLFRSIYRYLFVLSILIKISQVVVAVSILNSQMRLFFCFDFRLRHSMPLTKTYTISPVCVLVWAVNCVGMCKRIQLFVIILHNKWKQWLRLLRANLNACFVNIFSGNDRIYYLKKKSIIIMDGRLLTIYKIHERNDNDDDEQR